MVSVFLALYVNFSVTYELLYPWEVWIEIGAYLVAEAVLVAVVVVCREAFDAWGDDERCAEQEAS